MHRPALLLALTVLLASPAVGAADSAPAVPPPPKWYDTVEIHGLVDTYYSGNPGQPQADGNALRVFDGANGFQLSYAKVTALVNPSPVAGLRLDLGFGPTAGVLAGKPYGTGLVSDVIVQQAYATFKLGDVVLDAGKFVTNAGAEVIEAKDDWLYSRSILFGYAIPFTHTGVRATAPIPGVDGLSVMASLFNGWDDPPGPVSSYKTGHLAVSYSGPAGTTAVVNAFYGRQPGALDDRLLLDAVLARSFGDLSINLNGDYGKEGDARWYGAALMARYSFLGDKFRLTARGEAFWDPQGVRALVLDNTYWEATAGVSVPVNASSELRLEYRHDHADKGLPAVGGTVIQAVGGRTSQDTVQVAALAWF